MTTDVTERQCTLTANISAQRANVALTNSSALLGEEKLLC